MNARLFEELRPVGLAVAYRMLGSVSEAEDIVQEAFLRLHRTIEGGEPHRVTRAYLSTVVTRLCIDHLRSARTRRETYVEALPEPLVGGGGRQGRRRRRRPRQARRDGRLAVAGVPRAAREPVAGAAGGVPAARGVRLPYNQIAAIVATNEDNARQLVARARRHVEQRRPRFEPSPERRERLARRFFAAARDGDLNARGVAGPRRDPARRRPTQPLTGRVRVARNLLAGMRTARPASAASRCGRSR